MKLSWCGSGEEIPPSPTRIATDDTDFLLICTWYHFVLVTMIIWSILLKLIYHWFILTQTILLIIIKNLQLFHYIIPGKIIVFSCYMEICVQHFRKKYLTPKFFDFTK